MAVCHRESGYIERGREGGKVGEGKSLGGGCHLAAIWEEAGKWSKRGEEKGEHGSLREDEWKRERERWGG